MYAHKIEQPCVYTAGKSVGMTWACLPLPLVLHSRNDVQAKSQAVEEDKKLTALCQKVPTSRTEEEVAYICSFVAHLSPFFRLWPEVLQFELARVLATEVLVRGEAVVVRGTTPTKMYIILNGELHIRVHDSSAAAAGDGHMHEQGRRGSYGDATSSRGGGNGGGEHIMAYLRRGDSCGEVALMSSTIAHADVLVGSAGAVCLSLALPDFMKAFKEVMGLRQQVGCRACPFFVLHVFAWPPL